MRCLPQIDFAHARIGGYLLGRALDQNGAGDEHGDAAGEPEHQIHVVLDQEHGNGGGQSARAS